MIGTQIFADYRRFCSPVDFRIPIFLEKSEFLPPAVAAARKVRHLLTLDGAASILATALYSPAKSKKVPDIVPGPFFYSPPLCGLCRHPIPIPQR
jgi:hypothetical protein